jgi:outer membrane translocation and assembly module TamA
LLKTTGAFSVSPNPFRNTANISIDWDKNETTVVKVFSVTGTAVVAKSIAMKKGTNYLVLDELSKLPSGNFIVEFTTASGKLTRQIIKLK